MTTSGWPRRYTVVGLCFAAVFICYIDRVNISVAVLAMQEQFGWSETMKGLILSAFFIGYMLFQIPGGYYSNRWGGKIVLGLAVLWWSALTMLTPTAAALSVPILIVARIALGVGEAATFPAAYNLLHRWVPAAERSRAVALILSGSPLGTLVALTSTGWIVESHGWPTAFYLFGALGLVWAMFWFVGISNDPEQDPKISVTELQALRDSRVPPGESAAVPWRRLLAQPAVWALVINHFCSNWALYMLLAWLPSYFKDLYGVSIAGAGLYAAAPWLTMFLMINVGGWVADAMIRRGTSTTVVRKIMQIAGLLGCAFFLLMARDVASVANALPIMCGALGALALTWSGFGANHLDIAPRYADVLMGITNTVATIPGIIGVAVTGWLVDATGTYAAAFSLAAGIAVFGAVVWLAFGTGKRLID